MGRLRYIFQFYRGLFPISLLMNIVWAYLMVIDGLSGLLPILFSKNIVNVIVWAYVNYNQRNSLYYYYNLHLAKSTLWIGVFVIDILLFIITLIVANTIK